MIAWWLLSCAWITEFYVSSFVLQVMKIQSRQYNQFVLNFVTINHGPRVNIDILFWVSNFMMPIAQNGPLSLFLQLRTWIPVDKYSNKIIPRWFDGYLMVASLWLLGSLNLKVTHCLHNHTPVNVFSTGNQSINRYLFTLIYGPNAWWTTTKGSAGK